MQERHLRWPPTFSLATQWPHQFFHSRIATVHMVSWGCCENTLLCKKLIFMLFTTIL